MSSAFFDEATCAYVAAFDVGPVWGDPTAGVFIPADNGGTSADVFRPADTFTGLERGWLDARVQTVFFKGNGVLRRLAGVGVEGGETDGEDGTDVNGLSSSSCFL